MPVVEQAIGPAVMFVGQALLPVASSKSNDGQECSSYGLRLPDLPNVDVGMNVRRATEVPHE